VVALLASVVAFPVAVPMLVLVAVPVPVTDVLGVCVIVPGAVDVWAGVDPGVVVGGGVGGA